MSAGSASSCLRTSGRATAPSARAGIKAFARRVEELGFDSLFITDHLLAARRFYSVNWLEPLIDARGRRRRDGAGAARDVDPDHAAAQPGDPRQGARDAPVPVRQPGDPRRGRGLERRRVRGRRRPQVGARQAHRRDARHHDAAARGRAGHLPRPVLLDVDDVFIEPRTSQRPLLWIGGGSQLADPKSPDVPKFVASVKARTVKADGWIPRPTCPPQDIARDWDELQAAMREAGRDPSRLPRRPRELRPRRADRRPGRRPARSSTRRSSR